MTVKEVYNELEMIMLVYPDAANYEVRGSGCYGCCLPIVEKVVIGSSADLKDVVVMEAE